MKDEYIIEIIKIVPSVLGLIIATIFLIAFYKPIVRRLVPKMKELKLFGIEAAFFQQTLRKATNLKHKKISKQDEKILLTRIQKIEKDFSQKSILWIDDRPERSEIDRNLLETIGFDVEVVISSEKALEKIKENEYDIIISDIIRGENKQEGLDFLKTLRNSDIEIPLIYYLEFYKPEKGTPAFSFGITNEPKEMLHLVLDLIERMN